MSDNKRALPFLVYAKQLADEYGDGAEGDTIRKMLEHITDLERQLQEARGRCKYRFDNYCIAGFPCRCGLSHDTNTAGEPE